VRGRWKGGGQCFSPATCDACAQVVCYGFWHYITYVSDLAIGAFRGHKYNPENQYEPGEPG